MGNTDNDTPIDLLADINGIFEDADEITGELSPIQRIDGIITETLEDTDEITGMLTSLQIVDGKITYGNGTGETVPIYDGQYTVVPKAFEDIVLHTKNKKMIDDVTVKEIPYFETSNISGGLTVYIAGQIEFG